HGGRSVEEQILDQSSNNPTREGSSHALDEANQFWKQRSGKDLKVSTPSSTSADAFANNFLSMSFSQLEFAPGDSIGKGRSNKANQEVKLSKTESASEKQSSSIAKEVAILDDDLVRVTTADEKAYYYPPTHDGRLMKSERSDGTYHFIWSENNTLERYVRPDRSYLKFVNDNWVDFTADGKPTGETYATFKISDLQTGQSKEKAGAVTGSDLSLGSLAETALDNCGAAYYSAINAKTWENVGLNALSKFDQDGNALLDLDEIDLAISNSSGQYLSSSEEQFLLSARKNFDFLAAQDKLTGISSNDVTAIAKGLSQKENDTLLSRYKVDANGDQKISAQELINASKRLKTKDEVEAFSKMIEDARAGGGRIPQNYYSTLLTGFGQAPNGLSNIDGVISATQVVADLKNSDQNYILKKTIEKEDIKQAGIGNCPIMSTVLSMTLSEPGREQLKKMVHLRADGFLEVNFPGQEPIVLNQPGMAHFALVTPSSNQLLFAVQTAAGIVNIKTTTNKDIEAIKIPALATDNPEANMRQMSANQLLLGKQAEAVGIDNGNISLSDLDKRMTEIQSNKPIAWTAGTGGRLKASETNRLFKDKDWNALSEADKKVLLQNQQEDPANYPSIEKVISGHAYAIDSYDSRSKTVRLRNPHNGGEHIDIPLSTFRRAFSESGFTPKN
ncbi:MAG: hypothetical protein K8F91_04435, partial [Candidatus Obscuribacterales bacterium]|nr:hypothetical protein [Candidatus Obscuribacterales bacterium]